MPILSKPAFGPRTSIIYITVGSLIDVWTAVWYFAFGRGESISSNTQFWLWGFFLTGLTLVVVGLLLGHIGRAARRAELPPPETTPAEAQIQTTAAAHPNPVMGGMAPNTVATGTRNTTMPPASSIVTRDAAEAAAVPGLTRR